MQEQEKKLSGLDVMQGVVMGWACSLYLPLRRGVGRDHPGAAALFGMGWVLLFAAYNHEGRLIWIIPVMIASLLVHRLGQVWREARGIYGHTFYDGIPWIAFLGMKKKEERRAKCVVEPTIVMIAGLICIPLVSETFGSYFGFGAIAMAINQGIIEHRHKRREAEVRNAMIESRAFSPSHNGRRFCV